MSLQKIDQADALVASTVEPADVVALAKKQASALMDVVEDRKLYQVINDKKYLVAEAWETIGAFNRVFGETDWVRPIRNEADEITGYEAKVDLVGAEGTKHGSGVMVCGFDDFPCRGKEGTAQHKAAMSAAQTWALSKAYRMNYSWVVVLAEYEPTPAEEMYGTTPERMCPEHGVAMTEKSNAEGSWWSHPRDGGGWCNAKSEKTPAQSPSGGAQAPTGALQGNPRPSEARPRYDRVAKVWEDLERDEGVMNSGKFRAQTEFLGLKPAEVEKILGMTIQEWAQERSLRDGMVVIVDHLTSSSPNASREAAAATGSAS